MAKIQIKRPGEPVPRVEKRAIESLSYTLDCTALLEDKELITSIRKISSPQWTVQNPTIKLGKNIEVQIPEGSVGTATQLDSVVQVVFETSLGNTRVAVFQLTVHRQ